MKKIIGLTGGSGAGKGEVLKCFKSLGAYTIDTDITYKNTVKRGMPALLEIKDEFGDGVILENGELNRKALAKIVFNSDVKLHNLNEITHKYITEEIIKEIKDAKEKVVVIDAPALFESGIDKMCDKTVFVKADKKTRIERIMARDNLTETEAQERINAQKNDEFFIKACDFTIENNGKKDELKGKVEQILRVCIEN